MFEWSPQNELENIMFRDVGRWKLSGKVVEKDGWWRMRYSDKAQGTRFEDLIFHNFHKDKLQMQKFSRSMLGLKSGSRSPSKRVSLSAVNKKLHSNEG